MLMHRKRNCAPLDEIGVTIDGMVPRAGALELIIYITAIAGVAVLFFFML